MNLSQVTGRVVATQKDSGLEGLKLLICQTVNPKTLKPMTGYLVAVDTVGANEGDFVMTVGGSSARIASGMQDRPVDSAIIGIIDQIEIEGEMRYRKTETAGATR